jgi:hypothetical protein
MWEAAAAFTAALALKEDEIMAKKKALAMDTYMRSVASTYHLPVSRNIVAAQPKMCPHCHSRDFKYHHSRLICSYCRTGV